MGICDGNSPKFPGGTQILSLPPPHHLSPLISGYLSHGRGCDTCIAERGQQPQRPLSGCGWKIKGEGSEEDMQAKTERQRAVSLLHSMLLSK